MAAVEIDAESDVVTHAASPARALYIAVLLVVDCGCMASSRARSPRRSLGAKPKMPPVTQDAPNLPDTTAASSPPAMIQATRPCVNTATSRSVPVHMKKKGMK